MLTAKGGSAILFNLNSIDYTGDTPVLDPQILWHDSQIQIMNFLETLLSSLQMVSTGINGHNVDSEQTF